MSTDDQSRHVNIVSVALAILQSQMGVANLQYLVKSLLGRTRTNRTDKEYHRIYMKLYRFFKKHPAFELYKADSLVWVKVKDWARAVDLITSSSETQTSNNSSSRATAPCETAGGVCETGSSIFEVEAVPPYRLKTERILRSRRMLDKRDIRVIWREFNEYLDDISSKRIVLGAVDENVYPRYKIVRYRTRFNDRRYLKRIKRKYELLWDIASERYKYGVFLTLTTDPKRHKNLRSQYKHIGKAFNRFMSYVSRRLGFRPEYISMVEFTESGLPHLHVVLFGIERLMDKDEITRVWERTGQGSVNYVYAIQNRKGRWVWAHKRPRGTRQDVRDYLRKYLSKTLDAVEALGLDDEPLWSNIPKPRRRKKLKINPMIALYWASGKRFFTYSYRLYREPRPKAVPSFYRFLFVTYEYLLPVEISLCAGLGICDDDVGPPNRLLTRATGCSL